MRQAIQRKEKEMYPQTMAAKKNAPYWGLNFKRQILPDTLYNTILSHVNSAHPNDWKYENSHDLGVYDYFSSGSASMCLCDVEFQKYVMDEMLSMHEEWCGMDLVPVVAHGPRQYSRGAYLLKHVDKMERIISSTICIDYALDQPWPLYIEDGNDNPYYVDMLPGDFCFYESSRLVHGRPYPMVGDAYLGMFVHYAPKEK